MSATAGLGPRGRDRDRSEHLGHGSMEITGTSNAASAYSPSLAARAGKTATASNSGTPSASGASQPVDQFLPGTRHRPKKGKGNYKRPKVRPNPANKLDQDQLQAHHALMKRLDQERMAAATEKSGMYLPGSPLPLPALNTTPVPAPPAPPVAEALAPPAPPAAEVPAEQVAETTAAEAAAQGPQTVNVGPGELDITAQMLDKPSPESSGLLGTALGVGLAASELTAYVARDSLNPLVGARIIGRAAIDAAPGAMDTAVRLGPKAVDGAAWLGPKALDAAISLGTQAVDGALWLGPKIAEGTTDFIANAPGYYQTGVNGLQTAGDAVVNAAQVSANAIVDATPVAIQGAKDFATFVQDFQLPSAGGSTGTDTNFSGLLLSDPGAALSEIAKDPTVVTQLFTDPPTPTQFSDALSSLGGGGQGGLGGLFG